MTKRKRAERAKKRAATIQRKKRESALIEAVERRARAKALGWHQMRSAYFRIEAPDEKLRDELLNDGLIEQIFDRSARDQIAVVGGSQTFSLTDSGERLAKRLHKRARGMSYQELVKNLRRDSEIIAEREADAERQRAREIERSRSSG